MHTEDQAKIDRYDWIVSNPESGRHLLGLLMEGKGDETAFHKMVDRIIQSQRAAGKLRA